MKDLPEINLNTRKKKKGFIAWIRTRLGFGGGGGAMGVAETGAPILSRSALGAAKFGAAKAGLGGLLAGKVGFITAAVLATAAVGTVIYVKAPPPPVVTASGSSASKGPDYVPAVMRQQGRQGSSLDMFSQTNRGLVSMEEAEPQEQPAEKPETESAPATPESVPVPEPAGEQMGKQMVGKLIGSMGSGLSTTMGSGSGKFSTMGGFGNNFTKSEVGGKSVGMEVGAGFSASPSFNQRKNMLAKKSLAMKGSRRPVYSSAGGAGKGAKGHGAFSQAKGVKSAQRSYVGTNADSARSTQDKAWEGQTGESGAVATGGVGLGGEGGAGIVTSPSLDNVKTVGDSGNADDPVEAVSPPLNVSPWQGLPQLAMMMIMMSSALAVVGAQIIMMSQQLQAAPDPTGSNQAAATALRAFGMAICGVAISLGGMATAIGGLVSTMHGQTMMGGIYATGGGIATAAGVVAMTSDGSQAASVTPSMMGAVSGVLSLFGTMASTMMGGISTLSGMAK